MIKDIGRETTSFEVGSKRLAYATDFKTILKDHPGIMKTALQLMQKASEEYSPENLRIGVGEFQWNKKNDIWEEIRFGAKVFPEPRPLAFSKGTFFSPGKTFIDEADGLEVTVLGKSRRNRSVNLGSSLRRVDETDYFRLKLKLGNQSFFVKRSSVTNNPGFIEYTNTKRAKELLKDLSFVKVVDALLGYQNKTESWYVSKWEELEAAGFNPISEIADGGFNDYAKPVGEDIKELRFFNSSGSTSPIKKQVDLIKERLKSMGVHHDLEANLFYNNRTKTFILLDVSLGIPKSLEEEKENTLGEPFRISPFP